MIRGEGVKNLKKFLIALIMVFVLPLAAFADTVLANPDVIIVNPVSGSAVHTDNILVSVKLTAPTSIKVYVLHDVKSTTGDVTSVSSVVSGTTDSFTSTTNLSFFTKKIESVAPGDYRIIVETLGADGVLLFTNTSSVEIKAKEDTLADNADSTPGQGGPAQFLRNLLRIIFN